MKLPSETTSCSRVGVGSSDVCEGSSVRASRQHQESSDVCEGSSVRASRQHQESSDVCEGSSVKASRQDEGVLQYCVHQKLKSNYHFLDEQHLSQLSVASHQKTLSLSRQTGVVRRALSQVSLLTRRDLSSLADDLTRYSSLIVQACAAAGSQDAAIMASPADLWARIQECEKLQARTDAEKQTLKEKIADLNARVAELNTSLKDRDRCINDLNRKMEEGATEAEVQEGLKEKVRALEAYLLDIAQCVLRDSEQLRPDTAAAALAPSHAHTLLRLSRDSCDGAGVAPDLPQSTVSAVRSALADRQLQIHELQVEEGGGATASYGFREGIMLKLTSQKDQLSTLRKQYEAADATAVALESNVGELRDQLETVARERDATAREKERVLEDLEALQGEKEVLEKAKASFKNDCEQFAEELERRSRQVAEMEAERAAWHEERQHIHSKFIKERDDVAKHAHTIAVLHTELASVKQQVALLSDSVGKLRASEERLEEGREDLLDQVRRLERTRTELETQLAISQRQEAEMRHTIDKMEEYNLALSQEKTNLQNKVVLLESERATAATERAELRAEIERLQDQLAAADEDRAALETNFARLGEKLNLVSIEKEKVELELNDALSERNELHAHATALERTRNALEDELAAANGALVERDKQLNALSSDKDSTNKHLVEVEIKLSAREKDLNMLRESHASVKAEKHSLENLSAALEKKWTANENKRAQLEKDNEQLKTDKERVQSQLNKLQRELDGELSRVSEAKSGLERALDEHNTQHKKEMAALRDEYEEKTEALRKEKVTVENELKERLNATLHSMQSDRDEVSARKDAELTSLKRQLDKLHREKEDAAHRYQEEKHQALILAQQEISSLEEKVSGLQRDLSSYETQVEQLRRSGSTKAEAGRASEATLHNTIAKLKEDLHTANVAHDKQLRAEKDASERRLREIQARMEEQRRDHEMQLAAIKTDLRLAKEDALRFQQDLDEAENKIKEAESTKMHLQQEVSRLMEESRVLEDKRAAELQSTIKGHDYEKKDLQKKIQDRDSKISNLEVNEAKNADLISRLTNQLRELNMLKQEAQRAAAETANKLKVVEAESLSKGQELDSMRLRLSTEEDRHTAARQEVTRLKSKVAEYEREREGLNAEIALVERRLAELEDHHNAREAHLQASLEESRCVERRLIEEKKASDNFANELQQQVAELKVTASRDGGRAEALQQQLGSLEAHKDTLERRLHATFAALRTLTHAHSATSPPSKEGALANELAAALSESMFGLEKERSTAAEIDPEAMRHELKTLMNQINAIECERVSGNHLATLSRVSGNHLATLTRVNGCHLTVSSTVSGNHLAVCSRDEAQGRAAALEREVSDMRESQQRSDDRLRDVTKTLAELEEKKRHVEDKLNKSTASLGNNEEAMHRKESEIRKLTEEVSGLKRKLADLDHDRMQLQDRFSKGKSAQARLESEAGDLRERTRALEQRCGLLEDAKQRLETDLNVARRQATEKHAELETCKSSCDANQRSIRVLEDQNAALKAKVEELRARIAAAVSSECDLKDKLSGMNRSLKETVAASSGLEEELSRSQNVLSRTDSDRRQLEERLAACQASLADLRRQKELATEAKQKAQQDLANSEIRNADLEMKLKALRGNLGERNTTADDLISKVTRLEHEKMELRTQLTDVERKLAVSEAEKRDFEKLEYRLDKDRTDIKKILGKYSTLGAGADAVDVSVRDASLGSLRFENLELRRKLDEIESEKSQIQQKHLSELRDLGNEQRRERQADAEKLRRLCLQLETLRQEKERCQLRIHALEQQIQQYRDQLKEFRMRSKNAANDVRRVRTAMTDSLHNIATHPRVSTSALDNEIQNLSGVMPCSSPGDGRSSRRYGSVSPRRRRRDSGSTGAKKSLAFS
ncbi:hypothetical protein FHG87_003615 [Trinorchestia longiramus]|nr:hypothetical protein FHG87_003615 [Trinorchestia longiramus]